MEKQSHTLRLLFRGKMTTIAIPIYTKHECNTARIPDAASPRYGQRYNI